MHLQQTTDQPEDYLASSPVIDYDDPEIRRVASRLAAEADGEVEVVRAVFEFVRDDIRHTFDIGAGEVTCSASEVLKFGHGLCYAKSHLLAAILRYLGIPAGFCYQRLRDGDSPSGFVLHGLNAVYFSSHWTRLDARGNRPYVNVPFNPGSDILAFEISESLGESEDSRIFAAPAESVIHTLIMSETAKELVGHLPDGLMIK